jgi:BRCA1 C Terminus (BRCT) domain
VGSDTALLCQSSGDQVSTVTATADEQGRGSHQPLSGLLVAVSSLSSEASEYPVEASRSANAGDALEDEPLDSSTYNALVELCQRAGARTTSQVHKRVQVVVASTAAVHRKTQRVRKAWKLSIPVVRPSWVHRCLELKHKADWTEFLYPVGSSKPSRDEPEKNGGPSKSLAKKPSSSDGVRVVDLGCCCLCHESDSNHECPWCVDCGSNSKKVDS